MLETTRAGGVGRVGWCGIAAGCGFGESFTRRVVSQTGGVNGANTATLIRLRPDDDRPDSGVIRLLAGEFGKRGSWVVGKELELGDRESEFGLHLLDGVREFFR